MLRTIVGIISILLGLAAAFLINIITNDPAVKMRLRYAVGALVGVVILWLLVSSIPTDNQNLPVGPSPTETLRGAPSQPSSSSSAVSQATTPAVAAPCSEFAASPVPGPSTFPRSEDFSKWPTCDVPDVYHTNFDPTEPGYVLAVKTSGTHKIVRAPDRYEYGDFTLDVNVRRSTGGFFGNMSSFGTVLGVAFRIKPRQGGEACDSYYVFYVAPSSGHFALMRKMPNCDFVKVEGYKEPDKAEIYKDPKINHLTVICRGNNITLKANGVEVYTGHDDIGGLGQIGVAAGIDETPRNIYALFRDLKISP